MKKFVFCLGFCFGLLMVLLEVLVIDNLVMLLGYNIFILEDIFILDEVEICFGMLKFVDGWFILEISVLMYDMFDFMCGVEVFLNFILVMLIEGICWGME